MCVFCEIIKGNIPSRKVYEDEDILAILDISQTTRGHTLVMPKKHSSNFMEMDNSDYQKLMELETQKEDLNGRLLELYERWEALSNGNA